MKICSDSFSAKTLENESDTKGIENDPANR